MGWFDQRYARLFWDDGKLVEKHEAPWAARGNQPLRWALWPSKAIDCRKACPQGLENLGWSIEAGSGASCQCPNGPSKGIRLGPVDRSELQAPYTPDLPVLHALGLGYRVRLWVDRGFFVSSLPKFPAWQAGRTPKPSTL